MRVPGLISLLRPMPRPPAHRLAQVAICSAGMRPCGYAVESCMAVGRLNAVT
jgi:hypothetical protein